MKLNGNGTRSPDQIEAEIARTRSDLDQTLSAIESRLTPGQLMDQGLHYMRNSGARQYFTNLGESARSDPMPLALIGVGIAWLMMSSNRNRPATWHPADASHDASDSSGGTLSGMKDSASGAIHRLSDSAASARESAGRMGESARESMGRLGESARQGASRVGESVSRIGESARERMSRVGDSVSRLSGSARERAGRIGESARHGADRARGSMDYLVREQPLALGAIGLAIGAVIAAMTPRTRHEERLIAGGSHEDPHDSTTSVASDNAPWSHGSAGLSGASALGGSPGSQAMGAGSGSAGGGSSFSGTGSQRSSEGSATSRGESRRDTGSDWSSPTVSGASGEAPGATSTGGSSDFAASGASGTKGADSAGATRSTGAGMGGIGSGSTGIATSTGGSTATSASSPVGMSGDRGPSGTGSSTAGSGTAVQALNSEALVDDARGVTLNPQRSQSASRVPAEHLGRERLYPGSFDQPVVQPAAAQRSGTGDATPSGDRSGGSGSSTSGQKG